MVADPFTIQCNLGQLSDSMVSRVKMEINFNNIFYKQTDQTNHTLSDLDQLCLPKH